MIDDAVVHFEMEAIAGSAGPIMQVNSGEISIKPAAQFEMAEKVVKFDHSHIVQQWIVGDDIRLQIEVEGKLQLIKLVLIAHADRAKEKYLGRYVLTLERGEKTKKLTGRIKECWPVSVQRQPISL